MRKQNKPTQCDRILDYLKKFGTITSLQAYVDLGITQLAARITNLEERGYTFKRVRVDVTNRFGEKSQVVKYSLAEGSIINVPSEL